MLQPYKYAGYPMLIKTIQMETEDSSLFSKSAPLLAAAAECCYQTVRWVLYLYLFFMYIFILIVRCSALNAEELRREHGMEALETAFERCVGVLSASSKDNDVAVEVSLASVTRTFFLLFEIRERITINFLFLESVKYLIFTINMLINE